MVDFEAVPQMVAYPPVHLLEKLHCLRLGKRLGCFGEKVQVAAEELQVVHLLDSKVVKQASNDLHSHSQNLNGLKGTLGFLVMSVQLSSWSSKSWWPCSMYQKRIQWHFNLVSLSALSDTMHFSTTVLMTTFSSRVSLPPALRKLVTSRTPRLMIPPWLKVTKSRDIRSNSWYLSGSSRTMPSSSSRASFLTFQSLAWSRFSRGGLTGSTISVGGGMSPYSGMSKLVALPMGLSSKLLGLAEKGLFSSFMQFKYTECSQSLLFRSSLAQQNMNKGRRSASQTPSFSSNHAMQRRRYERMHTDHTSSQTLSYNHKRSQHTQPDQTGVYRPLRPPTREPEMIAEENLNLKKFINDLQSQLQIQRGKLQTNHRKALFMTSQLNRQFGKDLYYTCKQPNSYMISGVKQQYESMKKRYEQKAQEVESLMKLSQVTDLLELKLYAQSLEAENSQLKGQLQTLYDLKDQIREEDLVRAASRGGKRSRTYQQSRQQSSRHDTEDDPVLSKQHMQVMMALLTEERARARQAESEVQSLQEKCVTLETKLQERQKKVEFLEKLLIEKDNAQHRARKQRNKVEKEAVLLAEKINKMALQMKKKDKQFEGQVRKMASIEGQKAQEEKRLFLRTIQEKDEVILKLEKQIRFLTTILSYWKPLDEINREFPRDGTELPMSREQSAGIAESIEVRFRPVSPVKRDSIDSERMNQVSPQNSIMKDEYLRRSSTGNKNESRRSLLPVKTRQPQSCAKKYSQNAIKSRKIELSAIKGLGDLMRFRLIGVRWTMEDMKALFEEKQYNNGEEEEAQADQYLSMSQIKHILKSKPFELEESEAVKVSRYVVQDSAEPFVYWDQGNEIGREIAKSIMRALIGEYQLEDQALIDEQWVKLRDHYMANLQSALAIIAPKGIIPYQKFTELILGLGIEVSEPLMQWIVGKMVVESLSLEELNYHVLIPPPA